MTERYAQRNPYIDILNFVSCLLIMYHHTYIFGAVRPYPFAGAYILVEFFSITTGYYTVKKIQGLQQKRNTSTDAKFAVQYTIHKFKSIIPYTCLALFIYFIYLCFNVSLGRTKLICSMALESLLLQMFGFMSSKYSQIPPLWYLSALMIALPIFIYFCLHYHDFFSNIGVILIPLVIYSYFYQKLNSLLFIWTNEFHLGYDGIWRVFAGLCLGCVVWKSSNKLSLLPESRCKSLCINVGILVSGALLLFFVYSETESFFDVFDLLLLMVLLTLVFSKKYSLFWSKQRITPFLAKISMPLYICHWTVAVLLQQYLPTAEHKMALYYGLSLIYALVLMLLVWLINKCIAHLVHSKEKLPIVESAKNQLGNQYQTDQKKHTSG